MDRTGPQHINDHNNDKTTNNMAHNPKAKDNLRPFPKGVSGNPNGRPKKLSKAIKSIPESAQREIYGVLHHAICLNNEVEARAYLEQANQDARLGRYGFILQVAIKALTGSNGWSVLNDILDRLFGKPTQTTDVSADITARGYDGPPPIIYPDDPPEKQSRMKAIADQYDIPVIVFKDGPGASS